MFFFFFQAEDGIRDVAVTGVQTCALPICNARWQRPFLGENRRCSWVVDGPVWDAANERCELTVFYSITSSARRSEERRVGKECRSRLMRDHSKKTNVR